ncbi:MAG TPA: hypothetical protein VK428_07585 [Acidimicrobiales bacterium]|nr:hypothetical protein [Acidimicrobiales bacterium]
MGGRIVIVGGGSAHWAPSLLLDFANSPALADSDVVLMDVDDAALKETGRLGAHIAERRSIGLRVRTSTDLDEALEDAGFVITALSVGGFASMRHDIEIPARYGLRQPVGDSVGPGGISRSLRTIPVVVQVARTMERRCPGALMLNVSNPLTTICRAVAKETSVPVVGLCNEVVGLQLAMSLLFDVAMHEVDPVIAGVNHLPLATSMTIAGADGFAMLRDALGGQLDLGAPMWLDPPPAALRWSRRDPVGPWTKADVMENLRIKLELFSRFGVLPAASDTHVAEFLPWFVTAASDFGREWGVHQYGLATHVTDKAADVAALSRLLAGDDLPTIPSGELVAPLLCGLVGGREVALPMNLPNTGQVQNLPEGAVVECMGMTAASGLRPRDSVWVPSVLGECLRRVAASQELTVEAACSGERRKVYEAVLTDPTTSIMPYEKVLSMTDELLSATAAWLPQFT